MLSWSPFLRYYVQYFPRPFAAFPNGQGLEGIKSCRNDHHQSRERILAEPGIEPVTACPQAMYTTD